MSYLDERIEFVEVRISTWTIQLKEIHGRRWKREREEGESAYTVTLKWR